MRKVRLPSHLLRNSFFSLYHNASAEPQDHLKSVAVACALFSRCPAVTQSTQGSAGDSLNEKLNPSSPSVLVDYSAGTRALARQVASSENSNHSSRSTSTCRGGCSSSRNESSGDNIFCGPFQQTESPSYDASYSDFTVYLSRRTPATDSAPPLNNLQTSYIDGPDVLRTKGDVRGHAESFSRCHLCISKNKINPAAFSNARNVAAARNDICNVAERHTHVRTATFVPPPPHSHEPSLDKWSSASLLTCASLRHALWHRLASRAAVLLPRYSPAGLLQLLALFRHAGAMPQSLLHGVARYLLEKEPYGPPRESLWRVWMANDLVLLCRLLCLCSFRHEPLLQQVMVELCRRRHLLRASDIAVLFHAAHGLLRTTPVHFSNTAGINSSQAAHASSSLECDNSENARVQDVALQPRRTQQPQQPQVQGEWKQQQMQGLDASKEGDAQQKQHQMGVGHQQTPNLQQKTQQRGSSEQVLSGEKQAALGQQQQCRTRDGQQHKWSAVPEQQREEEPTGEVLQGNEAREESARRVDFRSAVVLKKPSFFSAKELQWFSRTAVIQLRSDRGVSLRDGVALLVGVLRLARGLEATPPFELLASCLQLVERRCCCVPAAGVTARLLQRAIFALVEVERLALLRVKAFLSSTEIAPAFLPCEQQRETLGAAAAAAGDKCDGDQALLLVDAARRTLPYLFAALSTRLDEVGPLKGLDLLEALRLLKEEEEAAKKSLLSTSCRSVCSSQNTCDEQKSESQRPSKTPDVLGHQFTADTVDTPRQQRNLPCSNASLQAVDRVSPQEREEFRCRCGFLSCAVEEAACAKQEEEKPQPQRKEQSACNGDVSSPLVNRTLFSSRKMHQAFDASACASFAAAVASSEQATTADDVQQLPQRAATAAQPPAAPEGAAAGARSYAERQRLAVVAGLRRIARTDAVGFDTVEALLFHVGRFLHLLPASHSLAFAVILKSFTCTQHFPVLDSPSTTFSQLVDKKDLEAASSFRTASSTAATAAVAGKREDHLSSSKHLASSVPDACDVAGLAVPAASAAGVVFAGVTPGAKTKEYQTSVFHKFDDEAPASAEEEDGSWVDIQRHKREVAEMLREILLENTQRNSRRWTHTELQQLHMLLQ